MTNKFGSFVRTERIKLGYSGVAFAKKLNITSVQLNNVETGKNLPRISTVENYARVLNVPKETLTGLYLEDYESRKL